MARHLLNPVLWGIIALPIFWACVRLRPQSLGWPAVLGGHALLAVAITWSATISYQAINVALLTLWPPPDSPDFPAVEPLDLLLELEFLDALIPYLLLLVVGVGRYRYLRSQARQEQTRRLKREAEQLRSKLTTARLKSLRMQINPHFFHNTLHTISTMAGRDPEGIRRAIARLSEMLRYALSTSDRQEVPLDEEIDFLNSYLAIQKLRLDERLDITLDTEPGVRQALVPTLLLQPLAENAVKHGFEGTDETGHLTVCAHRDDDALVIQVIDDGRGLDDPSALSKMETMANEATADSDAERTDQHGLRNIATRLRGLYGDAAEWTFEPSDGGGLHVTLRLPFHTRATDGNLRLSGVVAD
jgi:sensor histidine kinase YesM